MSIGERIAELRNKAELSQGQLAELLDVSRQAVSKWENDLSSPDTLNLIRLADALNSDVEFLATGKIRAEEPRPIVVNLVKQEDKVVEKTVEKVVEKPVIKKVIRVKYLRNPIEFAVVSLLSFAAGLFLGILL